MSWLRLLRRLFPAVRLARPRTVTKKGAVTEIRETLAFHFHFNAVPPRAPRPAKAAPKPRYEGGLWDTLWGKKTKDLTPAQVRRLPVEPAAAPLIPPPVPHTPYPGRQEWLRHLAEQADEAAIAAMQARHAAQAAPKRRIRKKPVVVEAHTRNGKVVGQHTRKKPTTAKAERQAK